MSRRPLDATAASTRARASRHGAHVVHVGLRRPARRLMRFDRLVHGGFGAAPEHHVGAGATRGSRRWRARCRSRPPSPRRCVRPVPCLVMNLVPRVGLLACGGAITLGPRSGSLPLPAVLATPKGVLTRRHAGPRRYDAQVSDVLPQPADAPAPTSRPTQGRLSAWVEVLRTTNPPKGRPLDPVSRWLVLTRAAVLPMTLVAGAVATLPGRPSPRLQRRPAAAGLRRAHPGPLRQQPHERPLRRRGRRRHRVVPPRPVRPPPGAVGHGARGAAWPGPRWS